MVRNKANSVAINLCVIALFIVAPVNAGKYVLTEGKGIAVCEAYKANLNSLQPKVPMVCGRSANPKMTKFSKPKWTQPRKMPSPSGASAFRLYMDYGEVLWARDVNPVRYLRSSTWPNWKGTAQQYEEAHKQFYVRRENSWMQGNRPNISEFDINNDGESEPIYYEKNCGSATGDFLAVLTRDYASIDIKQTEAVAPHKPFKHKEQKFFEQARKKDGTPLPGWKRTNYVKPVKDPFSMVHYDVFLYEGETFLDRWWSERTGHTDKPDGENGLLRVFKPTSDGLKKVCTFRFSYVD